MPYDNEYNRMISRDIDYFNRKYVVHSDATGQGTIDYRSQMSDMSRIGGGAGCAEYSMGSAKKGGAILGFQDGTVLGGPRVRNVSHRTEASFSSLGAPLQPQSGVVINAGNAQPYRDLGAMMNQTVNEVKAELQQRVGAGNKKASEAEARAYVEKVMKSERKKIDSEAKKAGKQYGSMFGKQEATSAVNAEVNKVKSGKGRQIGGLLGKKKKKKGPSLFGKKKKKAPAAKKKKKELSPAQKQQIEAKKKNAEAKKKLAEAKKKAAEAKQKEKDAKKNLDSKKKKKKSLYDKAKGHAKDVAGEYGSALKDIAIKYGTQYMYDMAENAYDNFMGGPGGDVSSDEDYSPGSTDDEYDGPGGRRGEYNECPPCKDPYNTLAQGADYEGDDGEKGDVNRRSSYFSGKGRRRAPKKKKQTGAGMITAVNALNAPPPGPKEKAQMYSSTMSGMGKPKKTSERCVLVKKVMKDKGLSMIEASKFVKENGLY